MAEAAHTEQFPIRNRWTDAVQSRRSTPRATRPVVRARVGHTSCQKRRLEISITPPVLRLLGWTTGGSVHPSFSKIDGALLVRLAPAHKGLRLICPSKHSATVRVAISGAPILPGLCAPIRAIFFTIDGQSLIASLPADWACLAKAEAVAK